MTKRILFDLETNGLLSTPWDHRKDPVSCIHCAVLIDLDTNKVTRFRPGQDEEIIAALKVADELYGHNIVGYDLPVLKKLCGWRPSRSVDIIDTAVWSRMAYPVWRIQAFDAAKKIPFSHRPHSLESWGYRLGGEKKGDYGKKENAWDTFSEEMLDYCEQDVRVNKRLIEYLAEHSGFPLESATLESNFQYRMYLQRMNGVGLDTDGAIDLLAVLTDERQPYIDKLREAFPPWLGKNGKEVVPKKSMQRKVGAAREGVPIQIEAGCPYQKLKLVEFNVNSGDHIARCLMLKYRWEPTEFTDKGKVKTKRDVMKDLPYEEAQWYAEADRLTKLIGLVSDGKQGWLRKEQDGVLHGNVKGEGTATGRCSHAGPNLAQVPKVGKPHGKECRALFRPTRKNWVMVGCDASGLEARMQAHYMSDYDGGKFRDIVLNGDIHTVYRKAAAMYLRDNAKTLHYAFLYGAGDAKLGTIILFDWNMAFEQGLTSEKPPRLTKETATALGKKARAGLLKNIDGLDKLKKAIERMRKKQKYIRNLDGRRIYLAGQHSSLNYLLQGSGAVLMKKALVLFDRLCAEEGWKLDKHYAFMLNVHDEWQLECRPDVDEEMARLSEQAIADAGKHFNLDCPHVGAAQIGNTWADTH